jgi:hypothetical protein
MNFGCVRSTVGRGRDQCFKVGIKLGFARLKVSLQLGLAFRELVSFGCQEIGRNVCKIKFRVIRHRIKLSIHPICSKNSFEQRPLAAAYASAISEVGM